VGISKLYALAVSVNLSAWRRNDWHIKQYSSMASSSDKNENVRRRLDDNGGMQSVW
jgi:hypothetical protein